MQRNYNSYFEYELAIAHLTVSNIAIANHIFTNTKQILAKQKNKLSYKELAGTVLNVYKTSKFHNIEYINSKSEEIIYEFALMIYWWASTLTPNNNHQKEKETVIAYNYLKSLNLSPNKPTNFYIHKAEDYSRSKAKFLKEYKTPPSFSTTSLKFSRKHNNYANYLVSILEAGNHSLYMSEKDRFFYVLNHKRSYYSMQKVHTGKTFNLFYEYLTDYKTLHNHDNDAFESELSAYILQNMIQSSSYSEYFLSCIDSPFISDKCKAATEFLPLYSKLFDTNHFSLTDYIKNKFALNKYFDLKNGLPVREESYYEFQIHNSFVLPMLYYVLLAIITEHYHTNFTEVIQNELHKYICEYMDTYYSYRNRFLNIFNKVSKLEKSLNISDNKVNKFKKSLIFASTEKDKIPYKINESIYASFFLTDLGQQPFPGQYLKRGSITPYDIAEENSCFYNINEPSLNFNSNIGPMIR